MSFLLLFLLFVCFSYVSSLNLSIAFSFCDVPFSIWYETVLLWIKKGKCQNKAFTLRTSQH